MLKLSFLFVGLAACIVQEGKSDDDGRDGFVGTGQTGSVADTADEDLESETTEDTGEPADEVEDDSARWEGQMQAEYTYAGSLGEFTEPCDGDAFINIDADGQIEGEGTCANDFISFGFAIEGSQDGSALSGLLVSESSAGRAETPFSGPLQEPETVLSFDHTHAADGESLRLVGTVNLVLSE